MIEVRHRTPPQHLWRWDGPYVWVGRWRIAIDRVLTNKIAMTQEELEEAAKIIWMLGFNAKTLEVQELMTKAAAEFSHFKYLLPPEIAVVAKKPPLGYRVLFAFGVLWFATLFSLALAEAVIKALAR